MVKLNLTNNQTAFEYALYMIAASYFDKTVCRSQMTEKNMLIQYKEQKLDRQYEMEDTCIAFMDDLAAKLPKNYFHREMEVKLKRAAGRTEIVFMDGHSAISFRAAYAGAKSRIYCQLWTKRSKVDEKELKAA